MIYILGDLIFFISALFPKSKSIWVFGSWNSKLYADNPKYLFEYINKNHPEIKAIWLSENKKIVKKIKDKGYNAFGTYSIKGLWYSCRAKYGVHSHGMCDINTYACAGIKIIQTWHGIAMKPILLSDPKIKAIRRRKQLELISMIFPFKKKELNFNKNLVICSSSPFVTEMNKKLFGLKAPIFITGYPRLDGLFIENNKYSIIDKMKDLKKSGKKIGIYMPTYRKKHEFDIVDFFNKNIGRINEQLEINNQILFFKIHEYSANNPKTIQKTENIFLITDEDIEGDIYSILNQFDFLISDYSSIIFDFLILARPIYLLVPDRENYILNNGKFTYDYLELELPISNNWNELLQNISFPITDSFQNKLNSLSNKFHSYKDNQNAHRLYSFIKDKVPV